MQVFENLLHFCYPCFLYIFFHSKQSLFELFQFWQGQFTFNFALNFIRFYFILVGDVSNVAPKSCEKVWFLNLFFPLPNSVLCVNSAYQGAPLRGYSLGQYLCLGQCFGAPKLANLSIDSFGMIESDMHFPSNFGGQKFVLPELWIVLHLLGGSIPLGTPASNQTIIHSHIPKIVSHIYSLALAQQSCCCDVSPMHTRPPCTCPASFVFFYLCAWFLSHGHHPLRGSGTSWQKERGGKRRPSLERRADVCFPRNTTVAWWWGSEGRLPSTVFVQPTRRCSFWAGIGPDQIDPLSFHLMPTDAFLIKKFPSPDPSSLTWPCCDILCSQVSLQTSLSPRSISPTWSGVHCSIQIDKQIKRQANKMNENALFSDYAKNNMFDLLRHLLCGWMHSHGNTGYTGFTQTKKEDHRLKKISAPAGIGRTHWWSRGWWYCSSCAASVGRPPSMPPTSSSARPSPSQAPQPARATAPASASAQRSRRPTMLGEWKPGPPLDVKRCGSYQDLAIFTF